MYQKVHYYSKKIIDEDLIRIKHYEFLNRTARKMGVELLISSYEDFYKGVVKRALVFDGSWKIVKNIKFDMIFDKTNTKYQKAKEMVSRKFLMINNAGLSKILVDKYNFYKIFSKFQPKTYFVKNKKELDAASVNIKTKKFVLKPCVGFGGKGVKILEGPPKKLNKVMLVQEFVTPKKHPEFGKVWDWRFIIINGKIDHSYVRVGKKNSFLSNLHQGGKMVLMDKKRIPESIKKIIRNLDKKFEKFGPRFYSIDFIVDKNDKPRMIEGNSRPTLVHYLKPKMREEFFIRMLNFFKNSYESNKNN